MLLILGGKNISEIIGYNSGKDDIDYEDILYKVNTKVHTMPCLMAYDKTYNKRTNTITATLKLEQLIDQDDLKFFQTIIEEEDIMVRIPD